MPKTFYKLQKLFLVVSYDDGTDWLLFMPDELRESFGKALEDPDFEVLHSITAKEERRLSMLARLYAAKMGYESETYPVVYFGSDTTGEKAYEEFYVPGEKINMDRFKALGVVEETTRRPMPEVNAFFDKLEAIFHKDDFTKAQVVEAIKEFIPNFEHEEKGKNLDQKM